MIRSTSRRRLVATVIGVAAVAAGGLLAGCGTGQIAETADIVPAIPGTNFDLKVDGGVISVRDASIDYPGPQGYQAGDNAPLTLRIVNTTAGPVTLTGASAATLGGQQLGNLVQVGGTPSEAPSAESPAPAPITTVRNPTPSPSRKGSTPPAASPSGSAQASAAPSDAVPGGSTTINVPVAAAPDGLIVLSKADDGGTYLVITGLTQVLLPGSSVRLLLTFSLADGSTVQMGASTASGQQLVVPVAVPQSPGPRSPLSLSPAGG